MLKNIIHKKAIINPLLMLSAMWLGFLLQTMGFFSNCTGAIIPLLPEGLVGIITSPLLHGNIDHIVGNSIPIAILMFLLYQFYPLVANKGQENLKASVNPAATTKAAIGNSPTAAFTSLEPDERMERLLTVV